MFHPKTQIARSVVLLVALGVVLVAEPVDAQFGVSSASLSMGRAGLVPDSEAIRIEEYFNYHKHLIAPPKRDDVVGLDVRWGNDRVGLTGEAILQVGLATRDAPVERDIPPLNLALVIDRSGSMSGGRIANVRSSLLAFVHRLRPEDRVSIVAFNQEAHLILEVGGANNQVQLREVIESITAGGSTNIHAGLMMGFEQVAKGYDPEKTNRVLLLTDGRTNAGVTDPEKIISDALGYNEKGIDVSTIGLGHDLNHELLRQLAKSGRGLIHFVDNAEDIRKIFVNELDSLLSPVARQISLVIEYDEALECVQFFGYEPRHKKNKIIIAIDDLNHHATQVLLLRLRLRDGAKAKKDVQVSATLKYRDITSGGDVQLEETVALNAKKPSQKKKDANIAQDKEVRKNLTIAEMAHGIKQMAVAFEDEKYEVGKKHLNTALALTKTRYPNCEDEDILRVQEIAENYVKSIKEFEVTQEKLKAKLEKQKKEKKGKTKEKAKEQKEKK